jgi:hypothetical protein
MIEFPYIFIGKNMKKKSKIIIFIILSFLLLFLFFSLIPIHNGKKVEDTFVDNKARIVWSGVSVPIRHITLIRKENCYGAVKFIKNWTRERYYLIGGTYQDIFASYESYYQEDDTGDFTKQNVIIRKGEVSNKTQFFPLIILSGHSTIPIGNPYVRCGPLKVEWGGNRINYLWFNYDSLYNRNRSPRKTKIDYELAPTKWTDITEVNVFDPRIKWYKPYQVDDDSDITIPIDKLWEEDTVKQESNIEGKDVVKPKIQNPNVK